ncbi:hypothetical protein [Labilithrix luteola]|uniref:hypothetical protein n=1 Tax=Labilithrix luteola TaxID=1391654 RepID=UPI0011BA5E39|nr:hypothetical protein [Labilithrix luteola]
MHGTSHAFGLWGSSLDDLWAATRAGVLHHWDGDTWSEVATGGISVTPVRGSGPNDVWAIAPGVAVVHWDGVSWSTTPTLDAVDIWAASPNDATACARRSGRG